MGVRIKAAWLLTTLALAAPAGAATIGDYTSFHVLGDSLSDVGNVYRTTKGIEPKSPPYWKGRFSNGPVWADRVANAFRREGITTGNHAWGGAKAKSDTDGIPDLALQGLRYEALDKDRRGSRPLVALFAGGNDVLRAAPGPGTQKVGRAAAGAVGDTAKALRATGVRDFLFFTLPDIGKIPKYADDPRSGRRASRGIDAFNDALDAEVDTLRLTGARVKVVDVNGLYDDLLANPRKYGVRNTTTPCLDDKDRPCTRRQGVNRAFFDSIHPNKMVHRQIAKAVFAEIEDDDGGFPFSLSAAHATGAGQGGGAIAPVPLPPSALLLVGALAVMGGLGYQRRARGAASIPVATGTSMASPYQVTMKSGLPS